MAFFRQESCMETHRRPRADGVANVENADRQAFIRSQLPPQELNVVVRYHPNLLIVGKESAVSPTVLALMSDFYPTVHRWPEEPDQFDLEQHTTLIVPEVGCLAPGSLDRLVETIDTTFGRVQVISTSSTPLLDRVQRGVFPAALYYRLNTLVLTLES